MSSSTGRGIFLVGSTAHVVGNNRTKKKDVSFVWINECEHLRIIVGRKDGNVGEALKTAR